MAEERAPGTRRQQLLARLRRDEASFEELRQEFLLGVRLLEDDLRHLERTLRGGRRERLLVIPARCLGCGYVFRGRASRHLHPPGRCPRCRREHIEPPRFRVDARD